MNALWILFDVSLALVVATHVILNKRKPYTAWFWIFVIWSLPLLGALLYWYFGNNRAIKRRRELPLPRPLRSGNKVDLLKDGAQAFPAMLDSIAKAKKHVDLLTYIFDLDRVGKGFVEALSQASARGVKVRVLVDGIGAWVPGNRLRRSLRRAGVQFASFWRSDQLFHQPLINLRNHRKLLLADSQVAYSGGLNISERHHKGPLAGHPLRRFRPIRGAQRDLHFRFRGPVVEDLQRCFDQDWGVQSQPPPKALPQKGSDKARVVTSGPDETYEAIYEQLLSGLRLARKSVDLCTPYFLPDEALLLTLRLLGRSGVRVRLFVPRKSDHFYMSWASRSYFWDLVQSGVEIWEIHGSFVHSKAAVVDGHWCLVGSCNLDPRSFRLNFEMNVELESRRLASEIRAVLSEYQAGARRVDLDSLRRQGFLGRLRDHTARLFSPFL